MTGAPGSTPARPLAKTLADLMIASWAYSAVSWAEETGLLYRLGEARPSTALAAETGMPAALVSSVLDVLRALGLVRREGDAWAAEPSLAEGIARAGGPSLRGDLRANLLLVGRFAEDARRGTPSSSWGHDDEVLLEAQGARSAALVGVWAEQLFPAMEGLVDRLAGTSGAFLDVGSGVAAISIAMCRRYPGLRCVGLDPHAPATAVARRAVAAAGLDDRIELRDGRFEDSTDEEAFDLVHVPSMFIPPQALRPGLASALAALRPGGWILVQVLWRPGEELLPAVLRLWCATLGSGPFSPDEAAGMLAAAGYEAVRVVPQLPGSPVAHVVGRRP